MSLLRNIPISRKFIIAFGIVCALCVLLGAFTFVILRNIAAKSAEVSGEHLPSMILIGDIRNDVNIERRETLEMMLCQTPSCTSNHSEKRQQAISGYQESLNKIAPTIVAEEREQYEKFAGSIKQYQDASDRGVALLAAGKTGDALDLLSSDALAGWLNEALAATDNGVRIHAQIGMDKAVAVTNESIRSAWINTGANLLIVMLCALIGITLTRVTAPRIEYLGRLLEQVAAKDLTAYADVTGTDEIGKCGATLNSSMESIRAVMRSVAKGAETLSAATTEISARSVQSAGNARTESSKINQIAAAVQEMTATIGEISHNAENAAGASRESAQRAEQGGAVMQAAAATMEKIATATRRFQTR